MANLSSAVTRSPESVLATNKLIRNTYTLLSMTLLIGAEVNGLISHRAGIAQPSRRLHHLLADKDLPPPLDKLTRRSSDRRSGR